MSYHNTPNTTSQTLITARGLNTNLAENGGLISETNKNISSFVIDTSDAPAEAQNRSYVLTGDIGAKVLIIVVKDGSQKYYNFVEKTFDDGHNSNSNLEVILSKKKNRGVISLPSGGGTFVIKVIALEGTTIKNSKKPAITRSIFKAGGDVTVTFTPFSNTANAYTTLPTFTSVGYSQAVVTPFSLTVTNTETEANGFGLIAGTTLEPKGFTLITEQNFFYSVTDVVNGTTSSSPFVVVDDLTGITVGSKIYSVSSGSLSGTPSILAIDTITNTLTLSTVQSFANDITLTFRSYGQENIHEAAGVLFDIQRYPAFTTGNFVKAIVRTASESGTVGVESTYGIAAGQEIEARGLLKGSTVTAVTQADMGEGQDGVITISDTSVLIKPGEGILFNCFTTATIKGEAKVSQFPTSNTTILLDLDTVITVGAAS